MFPIASWWLLTKFIISFIFLNSWWFDHCIYVPTYKIRNFFPKLSHFAQSGCTEKKMVWSMLSLRLKSQVIGSSQRFECFENTRKDGRGNHFKSFVSNMKRISYRVDYQRRLITKVSAQKCWTPSTVITHLKSQLLLPIHFELKYYDSDTMYVGM
jgi:hypothetical protein